MNAMIMFLTTPTHRHEVAELVNGSFASGLPEISSMDYHRALWAKKLPRATYIFTDFERLYPWELRCAADLFKVLSNLGLRCLNNPAAAMTRFELLRSLHRNGTNPFNVYRADDNPTPAKFPVFIRAEAAHDEPLTGLIGNEAALHSALTQLTASGWPRRLLLVVEFCAAPIANGIWRKHGTMRIGDDIFFLNNVIENGWMVKHGTAGLTTPAMFAEEFVDIHGDPFTAALRPVFDLAGLDYGRADHAPFAGAQVIYEINSHPQMSAGRQQRSPIRAAALAHAEARVAQALRKIDCAETGCIAPPRSTFLPQRRRRNEFLLSRR
jgi:hypothetical protein